MSDQLIVGDVASTIAADIAKRTAQHQSSVARLKLAQSHANRLALNIAINPPLVMLASGDSWFDYPLIDNGPFPGQTDIVAQLQQIGANPAKILSVAHHGDATTDAMAFPKQERMIQALAEPANWVNGKPDAILFSAGGNDVVGEKFCIYLNDKSSGAPGLNQQRFDLALGSVRASYLDLFAFRDRYASGVPIFGHAYDFAIPNGVHPICVGEAWLLPSLNYENWSTQEGVGIVKQALLALHQMLADLASDRANNFILVATQGLLKPGDWANELHPTVAGFKTMATAFLSALNAQFPGRATPLTV
jgi:hypothetical protein